MARSRGVWRWLTPPERERVLELLGAGERPEDAARAMGCSGVTVRRSRREAQGRGRRGMPSRLSRWSPEQISARLKAEPRGDPDMQVSHETIYQSLYIQSRGELRRQLTENLRRKRTSRRPRGRGLGQRGRITGMVPISARPPQ